MKYLLFGLALSLCSFSIFTNNTPANITTGIKGTITEPDTGEGLIGATIQLLSLKKDLTEKEIVGGTVTDFDGKFEIETGEGVFDLEISYTGYETKRLVNIEVKKGKIVEVNAKMKAGMALDEVVVSAYRVPLAKDKKRRKYEAETLGTARTETFSEGVATTPMGTAPEKIDIRSSRTEATMYSVDGVRVAVAPASAAPKREMESYMSGEYKETVRKTDAASPIITDDMVEIKFDPETYEEVIVLKDGVDMDTEPGIIDQPKPRAGLLTAGEWNDLNNWKGFWAQQWADGEIEMHSTQYGFRPEKRYTVLLSNKQDVPLVDIPVFLKNKSGKTLWTARTDNTGKAELWEGLFGEQSNSGDLSVYAELRGKTKKIGKAKSFESGIQRHKIKADCAAPNQLDIVWVVDATGSMGDELEYLKTELLDVINRVKDLNSDLNVRLGSVFYRDTEDEYLVKASKLSSKIEKTVEYIGKQSAQGGGDYPEAVDAALEEAILNQPWSAEAVARICFLVLDASPHDTPEAKERIRAMTKKAAEKGIRIVPVTGSGIQKDTEYLMKFLGLATNGSYVFLTDDSGIGGSHIEPTTDEYKVELLNDLLVRLITEYTAVEDCNGQSTIRWEQDPSQEQTADVWSIKYYPNPATIHLTLEIPTDVQSITLYNAEGKAVRKIENVQAGTQVVQVDDLPSGIYTMRIWKDGRYKTGKVLVVSGK